METQTFIGAGGVIASFGQRGSFEQAGAELLADHHALPLAGFFRRLKAVVPIREMLTAQAALAEVGAQPTIGTLQMIPHRAGLGGFKERHWLVENGEIAGLLHIPRNRLEHPRGFVGVLMAVERPPTVQTAAVGLLHGETFQDVRPRHLRLEQNQRIGVLQIVAHTALVHRVGINLFLDEQVHQRVALTVRLAGVHREGFGATALDGHLLSGKLIQLGWCKPGA